MGRAFFIKHRTSHLTIGVSDETNGALRPPATRPPRVAASPRETAAPAAETPKAPKATTRKPAAKKPAPKRKEKK
jgi:hypothetical protein